MSQLLSLTDLINNNEYVTLQNCSRKFIKPKGTILPITQVIAIRKNEFLKAKNIISNGILNIKQVTLERQSYARGILQIRKNWKILNYTAIANYKKQSQQQFVIRSDMKNIIYIDCSYVSAGDKIGTLDEFLVPLGIGRKGPVLGTKEVCLSEMVLV